MVSRLGLDAVETGLVAMLCASVVAGFVYRERSLRMRARSLELELAEHQSYLLARIEHWYDQSGVALV